MELAQRWEEAAWEEMDQGLDRVPAWALQRPGRRQDLWKLLLGLIASQGEQSYTEISPKAHEKQTSKQRSKQINKMHSLWPAVDVGGETKSLWMHTANKDPEFKDQFFLKFK